MPIIFRAKTTNAYNMKILAELLSNNIKVGHFVINEQGISLCMMDTHRKILLSVKLHCDNFSIFKLNIPSKKIYLGLNLTYFHKMLKSIKKKDTLELYIDSENSNKLGIKIIPLKKERVTTSCITIHSVQEFDIEIPEVNSKPIKICSSEFQKMVKDMNNIGNLIKIKAGKYNIKFSCETDGVLTRMDEFGETDIEDEDRKITYEQNFSAEQLCRITKIAGLSSNMKIYQGTPLLFKSDITELGEILIFIKSKEQLEKEEHEAKNRT